MSCGLAVRFGRLAAGRGAGPLSPAIRCWAPGRGADRPAGDWLPVLLPRCDGGLQIPKRFEPLSALLDKLLRLRTVDAPQALYAGAAAAGTNLPDWLDENPLPFPIDEAAPRICVGSRTLTNTHFDECADVAIVIGGWRRFTLFPPEQVDNLDVGPLHFTIAGPPVSMVDLLHPDFERYPRFATALEHAVMAELGPGDALFIPPLWWHDVEALDGVNVRMSYWWETPHCSMPC